jgi:predicted esterase YcpF (UPF0227 family)
MSAPLVYLHGLNSSGGSIKADTIRRTLAPRRILTPSYPAHRPADAVAQLGQLLTRIAGSGSVRPVLIGSSMGGFYGQFLARRFTLAHLFLINPALRPWELLPQFVGEEMTTALGERYRLTQETVEATRRYAVAAPCDGAVATTVFLDRGDEIIDYRIAQGMYRDCADVRAYAGGDHGFQHLDEAVRVIRLKLRELEQG